MLTPHFFDLLQTRYGLDPIIQVGRLTGGEWKVLYRLTTARQALVVSISHPTTTIASVQYEHAFLHYLHSYLSEVPLPIAARDGSTWFVEAGRIVTLLPLMPGQIVDRDRSRLPAARLLARYHQVALTYPERTPRPDVPAWYAADWDQLWDWSGMQRLLHSTPTAPDKTIQHFWQAGAKWTAEIVARREQITQERSAIRQWMHQLAQSDPPLLLAPIHDDYHRKNLLLTGDTVTALLDWDGCHPDWLLLDLSVAAWEFCVDKRQHTLQLGQAQNFVDAYAQAGGPLRRNEHRLIIPLICCRRMIEILSDLQKAVTGDGWDADCAEYLVHNLRSLENLRRLTGLTRH